MAFGYENYSDKEKTLKVKETIYVFIHRRLNADQCFKA